MSASPLGIGQFAARTAVQTDVDDIARAAARGDTDGALREAARQFESVFVAQLFKSMRATVPKEGLTDAGFGGEVFTDMLDQEYAKSASSTGGLGLAEIIAGELGAKPRALAVQDPTAATTQGLKAYRAQAADTWRSPVDGRVSSPFGSRVHPISGQERMHDGLDLAAPTGTPIRAARAGEVVFAGEKGGYGNAVVLEHRDGTTSLYGHASVLRVEAGQSVRAGEIVAEVGSTGHSTGPHLHFEVRRDGEPIDPRPLLGLP